MEVRIWFVENYERWGKTVDVGKNLKRLKDTSPSELQRDLLSPHHYENIDKLGCLFSKIDLNFHSRENLPEVLEKHLPSW